MLREEYTKEMNNDQMLILISKVERFAEFLRDLADVSELYANTGKSVLQTRSSSKEGRKALDYGEFYQYLQKRNPDAAHHLSKAEVLKFDWGRLHIRFPDDGLKAALGWSRHQIEMLAEKFYGTPFKITVKQSLLPY